ncbi:UbiA-like polyprenyltransferase [Bacillus horti]|uniref:4-hydroxybenzoate polyprenyltransferase n=1 Tax=Caldalkalibacillus horti TaxID=77523 RepID=A0ABT9VXW7_9BACI|nr:UbiA-like polyprenyltransferase [Bacillus horti]MDQ0165465.1 4-hydroxybenzoate polyprenyltransferase [Bacillus horti]
MNKFKVILEMIKFEHTIFALPFAFVGAILGTQIAFQAGDGIHASSWPTWGQIFWIVLAMVGARSAAMALNRQIDRFIDAKNPRTSTRAIPAGKITSKEILLFIAGSFILLFVSAYMLNPLAVKLLPVAVFFLVLYSYTKRFTWACHYILGIAIALAPLGGWVGATGTLHWESVLLFLAILFWTAGFDIIYATQDTEFDKKANLYSIPSYFGVAKALWISRVSHVLAAGLLFSLYFFTPLGWIYLIGCFVAAGILIYEHSLVKANDLSKVDVAFFTMNGILSVVIFVFTITDLVILQ